MRIIRRIAPFALCALFIVSPRFHSAESIPRELTDDAYWKLVNSISEEGGFFRFQFMSNEREFPSVIPTLKKSFKPGGVYLGVGPEQNFTYIAATQPKIAFIFDIRRQNMIEHLIYKAAFELSANRAEFVSRLFSRKIPAGLTDKTSVAALFQAFGNSRSDVQLYRQNLQGITDQILKVHKFQLSANDQADIGMIYQQFYSAGPGAGYSGSFGGYNGAGSNYAALMTSTDDHGQAWSYLASEENYQVVRDMERRNLIVPLVGDFAGTKAIRAVGNYLKEHGAVVSTFYASNVEQYLFQQGDDWRHYYANVAALPLDASSTFIRSSHYSLGTTAQPARQFGGTNYVMLLCSMVNLTKAFNAGRIQSYDDVIRMSHE
jgi:hypothetical protein